MAAFDIENGTPVINTRVEQIRAALTPAGQFGQIAEQAYLIKKWLDRDATSLVFGASNTGKSFFALDLAIHVAAGGSCGRSRERDRSRKHRHCAQGSTFACSTAHHQKPI